MCGKKKKKGKNYCENGDGEREKKIKGSVSRRNIKTEKNELKKKNPIKYKKEKEVSPTN